ncbi:hypothetical protein QBC34DRAFT_48413 [Podospora aff. communis PSN243]|uniref:CFEM domain-containing protein n=1 Tax=Podospora aff. communis PSN243 TaxID=3040156 RepID=A0AAV9GV07_9PEZI|nr:hypothetical protein QBC34DRAFT_48413 [Podospora aff. communis PSN243]
MKLSVALQLAGAVAVLAQGQDCTSVALNAIPSCAQPCYLENAPSIGCAGLDFACQCKQKTAMFNAIQGCVATKCPESEFERVVDGSNEVCDCAAPGFVEPATPQTTAASTLRTVQTVANTAVNTVVNTAVASSIAAPTVVNEDYDYPARPTPTYFATASGAERSAVAGLGVVFSAFLALMVL